MHKTCLWVVKQYKYDDCQEHDKLVISQEHLNCTETSIRNAGKGFMNEIKTQDSVLNPTVIKLGFVSFFADISSEMLYPITPIFLTTVLGASMASLGLIEGFAEAVASLLKIYSGSWSDSISKRKPFVIAGYFLAAISKPLIGFSSTWTHVLSARALDRTGKGIRSAPRDALIAESVHEKNSGAAFGWHRGMDTLGAALGPLIAIYLLSVTHDNYRSIYSWALIPGFISVLIVFMVKEKKTDVATRNLNSKKWENPFVKFKDLDFNFKKYLIVWAVFSLTNSSDVFLLLKAKNAGLSTTSLILMYCSYNLIYAVMSPILGQLSDKMDRRKILFFGFFIFSIVYLCFGFATEAWHFVLLFLTYGLYMAATDGVGKAMAIDLIPKNLKATGLGILGTVTGICTLFASVAAGLLWDHLGSQSTFIYGATGAFTAAAITIFFVERKTSTAK